MNTIVYILGVGRSGSTLLDIILDQSEFLVSCGELTNLSSVVNQGLLCSCKERLHDCEFWSKIISFDRLVSPEVELGMNHHFRFSSWLRFLIAKKQRDYIQDIDTLIEQISSIHNVKYITDSSKSPLRLASLLRYSKHDIKVIHLVRDPIGVSKSLARSFPCNPQNGVQRDLPGKPILRSYLLWLAVNILSEIVLLFLPKEKKIRIRYEDIIVSPERERNKIYDFIELRDPIYPELTGILETGHIMAGNRMRMAPVQIFLQKAYEPRKRLASTGFGEFLSFPLRYRYGYSRACHQ